MSRVLGRIETLARRVRWLDRYRRAISIIAALLVIPLVMSELAAMLGAGWPRMHVTALSVIVGIATWCVTEIGLAWVTAVWETEYSVLLRDRGLPRAYLCTRKPPRSA